MIIRKLYPRKGEGKIVELSIPIRFFWNADGTFDCVEVGPFGEMTQYEDKLMKALLAEMGTIETGFVLGDNEVKADVKVPKAFIDAFKNKKEEE